MSKGMVSGVIQARMGAVRLPGKTLMEIEGKSLLAWTILATRACPSVERVVVATTVSDKDDPVVSEAERYGAEVFRGDEEDVRSRYLGAAEKLGLDVIVRVCADRVVFSPWVCHGVVQEYLNSGMAYVSNMSKVTFPIGIDVEIFNRETLIKSCELDDLAVDREHVTPAIRRHPEVFSCLSVVAPAVIRRPLYRVCVDTQEDLDVARELFAQLEHRPDEPPDIVDVVELLDKRPDLTEYMLAAEQKYSGSTDTDEELATLELSLSYRDEFYAQGEGASARGNDSPAPGC